ncbi:methionyl-tRNA formyltransferase [Notoacmeibacter ruber]|uniref:Methionyl-tRNA formyltransferase n=2 Tax=Notoacmeibacter ruber TaxID=2670375 RepID=A0A3L7JFQ6_9HYPH|nr:methionyl-tRNA formyltransferase [Notoacmeibacter ruber]
MERISLHDPIEAIYYLHEKDGRKLFQLNTMGRDSREIPGKVSQSIQLDQESAEQLVLILQRHFNMK